MNAGNPVTPGVPIHSLFFAVTRHFDTLSDDALSSGFEDGPMAVSRPKLLVDQLDLGVDRVGADEELVGNILAGKPCFDTFQDFFLAR